MTDSAIQVNPCAPNAAAELANINRDVLQEGLDVLHSITSEQFTADLNPTFQATIGAHFRHLIEHYQCFLSQLEDGHINYDCRPRQSQIESDLSAAILALEQIIKELNSLEFDNSKTFKLVDEQSGFDLISSISREFLFLQAHTVHHYAIIAAMMRILRIPVPKDFGIAISTQQHLAKVANQPSAQS